MSPHRLRRAALHLPTRRSERGLLYFYHGLLAKGFAIEIPARFFIQQYSRDYPRAGI
jgi:hypothetical protein